MRQVMKAMILLIKTSVLIPSPLSIQAISPALIVSVISHLTSVEININSLHTVYHAQKCVSSENPSRPLNFSAMHKYHVFHLCRLLYAATQIRTPHIAAVNFRK